MTGLACSVYLCLLSSCQTKVPSAHEPGAKAEAAFDAFEWPELSRSLGSYANSLLPPAGSASAVSILVGQHACFAELNRLKTELQVMDRAGDRWLAGEPTALEAAFVRLLLTRRSSGRTVRWLDVGGALGFAQRRAKQLWIGLPDHVRQDRRLETTLVDPLVADVFAKLQSGSYPQITNDERVLLTDRRFKPDHLHVLGIGDYRPEDIEKFDVITLSQSFPWVGDRFEVLKRLHAMLSVPGYLLAQQVGFLSWHVSSVDKPRYESLTAWQTSRMLAAGGFVPFPRDSALFAWMSSFRGYGTLWEGLGASGQSGDAKVPASGFALCGGETQIAWPDLNYLGERDVFSRGFAEGLQRLTPYTFSLYEVSPATLSRL